MRFRLAPLLLGLAAAAPLPGCSYTFDSEPPDFPLTRTPVPASFVTRLGGPEIISFVRGQNDSTWLARYVYHPAPRKNGALRLLRADPPFDEDPAQFSDRTRLGDGAVYDVWPISPISPLPAPGTSRFTVHTPGAPVSSDDVFIMPGGPEFVLVAPGDVGFLYYVMGADHYFLSRRNGTFSRRPSVSSFFSNAPPSDAAGTANHGSRSVNYIDGPAFDDAGSTLITRGRVCALTQFPPPGACGPAVVAHSTTSERDVVLPGITDEDRVEFAPDQHALLVCGPHGLVRMPLDGSPQTVLDGARCYPMNSNSNFSWMSGGAAYYYVPVGNEDYPPFYEIRALVLDGHSEPRVLLGDSLQRGPLAVHGGTLLLYTRDRDGRWAGDATDGWIGETRLMERGRAAAFSHDGTRLRFIEHAADWNGAGDLLSVPLGAGGETLRLARNATAFHELDDGRVVALDNQAYIGLHNRVVLIDEKTRTSRILVERVVAYYRIPRTTDLLLEILTESLQPELWRVSIPPPSR